MLSKRTATLAAIPMLGLLASPGLAQTTFATVNGEVITEADVRALAATELEAIENERLQFEAGTRQREHETMLAALDGMIADLLIEAEAESRNVSVAGLMEVEVAANQAEPDPAELERIYQLNAQRLTGVSREAGLEQVRQFILERDYDIALEAFVMRLREEHDVETEFGPYRVPLVVDGHPAVGPAQAPITIVEFSDFECPFCRQTQPVLDQIESAYGERMRLVYRQFPLVDIHPRAQKAAEASLCADELGVFWEMHDAMFAEPIELEVASLKFKASNLGIDTQAFGECLDSGRYADRVTEDLKAGIAAGVTGTPTIYINGRPVGGAQPFEVYAAIIEEELARQ
jgi:predicted DsbA family dithiol-disulfide isomerase